MLAAPLLDENRFSFSLNSLGFDYLQEIKSEAGLKQAASDFGVHPKKELWKLPALYVGDYAEQDAALTLKLSQHFKPLIRMEELESIFNLETDLLPVLIDLTFKGIRFDREKCVQLIDQFKKRGKELHKELNLDNPEDGNLVQTGDEEEEIGETAYSVVAQWNWERENYFKKKPKRNKKGEE
jgi:DNA polymerase I-like protein with 3'-5' exonuclease and polymerase domains